MAVVLVSLATVMSEIIAAIVVCAAGVATTTAALSAFITDVTRRVRYGAAYYLLADLHQGFRLLTRAPGFATLAVLILASGIGAATLMFSLVHAALLRALPFADPNRVVWMYNLRTERDRAPLSAPDVDDYRRQASSLAALAVFTNWTANLTGMSVPERLEGSRVSGNFFDLLGVRPFLGHPDSARRRGKRRARRRADARVVDAASAATSRSSGAVSRSTDPPMPWLACCHPLFMFPFRDAELAVPINLRSDPRRMDRGANFLRVLARLGDGITIQRAKADLDAIAHRLQIQYPNENARKTGVSLYPLHTEISLPAMHLRPARAKDIVPRPGR